MRMKAILCAVAMLWLNFALAEKELEIRISPELFDQSGHTVYASVEVLISENETVVLADQNYRLYYNAATLSLDTENSYSDLPSDKYGDLEILEKIEGANGGTGQLSFDQNLGFVNFRIDLLDNNNGGVKMSNRSGWQKVAVLKFNLKGDSHEGQFVWSRPEVTDQYATAFVELTEWVAPFETSPLSITHYQDADVALKEITAPIHIAVGPNPTADFIKIDFTSGLQKDLQLVVTDVTGATWVNDVIPTGTATAKIDISGLASTMYMVELIDVSKGERIHHTQITKVD